MAGDPHPNFTVTWDVKGILKIDPPAFSKTATGGVIFSSTSGSAGSSIGLSVGLPPWIDSPTDGELTLGSTWHTTDHTRITIVGTISAPYDPYRLAIVWSSFQTYAVMVAGSQLHAVCNP